MSHGHGTACGKVILLGEHAVVYGTPAIAAGIERGAQAKARIAACNALTLGGAEYRVGDTSAGGNTSAGAANHVSSEAEASIALAFTALLNTLGRTGIVVEAASDLPPGGGLGSSAALGVAIARAVEALWGAPDPDRVLAAAGAWERVFHGNPSGIDTTAAAVGGCFRYTRAAGPKPLALRGELWLAVGLTGATASTKVMVEGVARLFERKPDLKERMIPAMTSLVENAALAIEAGDLPGLGRLLDLNQMLLAGLFVSTETIEAMCSLARGAGALGAKLTGAGGGGAVIALLPARDAAEAEEVGARVLAAWRGAGYEGFVSRIGAAGELPGKERQG